MHPSQLYLEINPSSSSLESINNRISLISQHLTSSGIIVLFDQDDNFHCPQLQIRNILCLKSTYPETVDQILTMSLSPTSLGEIIPAVVKISNFHPNYLNGTRILRAGQTLFYLELTEMNSAMTKEIIENFLSEGYDLFWHLSFSLDIGSFFPVRFASTYYLSSHLITSLIAIPVTLSYSLFSALSQSYKREMFFPFESGKYRLSDYDLHYLFEVNESNHLLTNLQISSLRLQQDACHSSKSIHIRISPLYLGNHLNALLEPPPPQDICLLALSKSLSGEESLFFALDLSQYISNNQVHLHVVTPLLFNQSSASSILLFPPHLTSSGLQLYLLHYCGQLRNVVLFDICLQFLSARYHEFFLPFPPHHDMLLSSSQASSIDVEGIFDPITHIPFALRTSSTCFDSLWCDHTEEFQRRLHHWQNPSLSDTDLLGRPHVNCENAKFLIFEPFTTVHGIGSIILQISIALRFAICHGRILYLPPSWVLLQEETHRRWMADHCNGSILDCYFLPPSSCQLTELDIMNAPYLVDGDELEYYPLKMERVVAMLGLPTNGHCTVCGSEWSGDFTFFDGLSIKNNVPHESFNHLKYMFLFLGKQKLPWLAQMTRYLLRPRPWFAKQLQEVIRTRLSSPKKVIPRPFASIHVRYGEKVLEVNQVPLENYMAILGRKAPHIHHVFLSTETESVIHNLTRSYPNYTFHYLHQPRHEYIHTGLTSKAHIDFVDDFISSMSNLAISLEADMFIGTLTSSWCIMIHGLQRTRGDGGRDYHTVDRGSAYTVCY